MSKILLIIIVVLMFIGVVFGLNYFNDNLRSVTTALIPSTKNIAEQIKNSPGTNDTQFPLAIPDNFTMTVYAENLDAPRDLDLDPSGTVVVSAMAEGKIYALVDGQNKVVAENLTTPHGIDFHNGRLYVAEQNKVSVFDYNADTKVATNKKKLVDLPSGGNHVTRSILVHNNQMYISIGSSCNVCVETDDRAKVMAMNLDGTNLRDYANGLRNSVFMATNPKTQEIWATEMGRDMLEDNTPPEEINILRQGNFGWPYCYGNNIHDDNFDPNKRVSCSDRIAPHVEMQAHSAPLGLAFWEDSLLVAFHGSWNRSVPTGYKIVKINPETKQIEDWITGWLQNGQALGRPVDILVKSDNEIYISDYKADVVYKLRR